MLQKIFFDTEWPNNEIGFLTLILGLLKRVSHNSMKSLKVTLVPVCSLWLLSVMSSVSINGGWEQVRISIWNTNKRQFCHRNFFATIFLNLKHEKYLYQSHEKMSKILSAFFQYCMYFFFMKNIIHMKNSKHSNKSYFENWLQYMYNQNQSSLYIN